jgi:glucose-6-phosphate isomerase
MALNQINPTSTHAWHKLKAHFETMEHNSMKEMFRNDTTRTKQFHIQWNDFVVDFSKNNITKETVTLLLELAHDMQLKEAISKYFDGDLNSPQRGILLPD